MSGPVSGQFHNTAIAHGSPRHPLLGFLTEASAGKILPDRPVGSLGLVGHTHEPALFAYDGAADARGAARSGRVLRLAHDRRLHGQPGGGLRQPARRGELVAHRRH